MKIRSLVAVLSILMCITVYFSCVNGKRYDTEVYEVIKEVKLSDNTHIRYLKNTSNNEVYKQISNGIITPIFTLYDKPLLYEEWLVNEIESEVGEKPRW